ncbi:YciE/YciF ferroxidase family protein [Mucilaginibacter ginkgonis]|uniref:Ferritin-like domain-containing protein n=1 Tax=Mucilaginibacter ginkgonis TaxID=2682091 RepID=A0A6I4HX38_9SPHI|nr:ferritin-like domain-containing protein [Mucilaginibacter ginkgonis]QQL51282.1 ferritin-like domain-containing protein [Mucilaginibacter ginkgonis]
MKKETGDPKFSTKTSPEQQPALLELFVDSIKDIYWAENHLVTTLPKMIAAATSKALIDGIEKHLEETKIHVTRLENIFNLLEEKVQAQKCDAMEGLAKEGETIVESTEAGTATRDVGIILASQKVEHYEIATYGGLHQLAVTLGLQEVADILAETLAEEKAADEQLTQVAESDINYTAAEEA